MEFDKLINDVTKRLPGDLGITVQEILVSVQAKKSRACRNGATVAPSITNCAAWGTCVHPNGCINVKFCDPRLSYTQNHDCPLCNRSKP